MKLSKNSRSIFRKAKDFYIKCIRIFFKSKEDTCSPVFLSMWPSDLSYVLGIMKI